MGADPEIPTADPGCPHNVFMTPQLSCRFSHARRRVVMACLGLSVVLAGCGLENEPGALRAESEASDGQSSPVQVAPTGPTSPVEADSRGQPTAANIGDGWYLVELGDQLQVPVPLTPGWRLADEGSSVSGASYLLLINEVGAVQIRAQLEQLDGPQTAAAWCETVLRTELATDADRPVVPTPLGNPAPGAGWVDAASCAVNGVPSPDGLLDYRLDVVVRAADGLGYQQLLRVAPGGQNGVRQNAIETNTEMLRRVIDQLDHR